VSSGIAKLRGDEKIVVSKKAKVEDVDVAARTKRCVVVEPITRAFSWLAVIKFEEFRNGDQKKWISRELRVES
jgi:hypothetical protein